jgi:protein-disulfide isomerase
MPARRPLAAAALMAVFAVGILALGACSKRNVDSASMAQADDMSLGDPRAKVEVVEYASASCPHCARFAIDVFPVFKAKYIDTGKVHFTLKEYLTEPQALAAAGFLMARCAGKDRYFPVLDAVFRGQEEMVMTPVQLDACMRDMAAEKALAARADRHVHVDKITSTPTFIINGRRAEGEMTLPELDAAIAKAAR